MRSDSLTLAEDLEQESSSCLGQGNKDKLIGNEQFEVMLAIVDLNLNELSFDPTGFAKTKRRSPKHNSG